ncbi:class I adenylate-forming enzyme family protein [Mycobacterium conspicuum]|jgi:fatty-acyl-CoA synthase|uniref:AMP-binding protein n=1 Tax=Mycobacterium conspicuum TaxID=44010 RepID=A0A1X1TJN1_9MYCO|nr:class I adenylate-forming enzyme family protein [Mycobacterium conspicuum]ORV44787.1 AMP-dependent synthetase [Mycobacterium conspicuum]BBZ42541.1 AMP-binding protein [Mycobacterium conspicuum]
MVAATNSPAAQGLSIVSGPPLADEPGLGALTLPGFLREVTRLYGEREALVWRTADGATRWSYGQLWERAVEVARALRAGGLGKDGRVGVLMTNRPEWLAAVFGTALAGGVAVTLSTFSTAPELDYLLRASAVSVLLFERRVLSKDFAEMLTELEPSQYPFLRRLALVGESAPGIETWDDFLASGHAEPPEQVDAAAAAVLPSDAAVLFFSSGSTSKPKGILSTHRGVCIQLWRFRRMYGFSPDDHVRGWTANGFFWSGNFAMVLGSTLASGGSLVLQSTFDAAEALELMQAERVSFPFAWPHQWTQLEGAPNWSQVDLSSVKFADFKTPIAHHPTVSGEWHEPGHAYGNTETFTITTGYPANTPPEVHAESFGVALPGVTLKITDPLTGDVVPRGEPGEISVKGPTLMLGYIGTPLDETLDAEGFFPTGDGGYLDDDGRLYWQGRLTDIIKTGGANVSPREVDETLISHSGVKVAQTVGVPHQTLGEVVVACIVPHDGVVLDTEQLLAFARQRLASYKVPRHVLFFREDEVALTGNAKIKAGELRELAAKRIAETAGLQ